MQVRTILLSLAVIAAVSACGCGPQQTYNEPEDPAKEAAAIQGGPRAERKVFTRRKITKPPGPAPAKALGGLQPVR